MKSLLSSFISREKKEEVELLFEGIREESKLFEEFLMLHEKKVEKVKKIIPDWEKGQLADIDEEIEKIQSINSKLLGLINKILMIVEKERKRVIFYFIIKEKMNMAHPELEFRNKRILDRRRYSAYMRGDLEKYFIQLFDFLKSLSKLILRQVNTINRWGKSASARLAKDIIEKENFYYLLFDETVLDRKIKQYLILIIREINKLLGSEKKFGFEVSLAKIAGKDEVVAKGVVFYELRDVYSRVINQVYELMNKYFHPDEVWPKYMVQEYLNYTSLKENIKEGVARTNMVVGLVKDEVAAFAYFDTLYDKDPKGKNDICFGVSWWELVAEGFRGVYIAQKIDDYRTMVMERSARIFKSKLDCILAEVEDPKKMTQQRIQEELKRGNNPFNRLRFFRGIGMVPLKFNYIQPAWIAKEQVYDLTLMIRPYRREWIQKKMIHVQDMERIWRCFVEFGYAYNPNRNVTYKKVLQNIRQVAAANNGFVPFGWD